MTRLLPILGLLILLGACAATAPATCDTDGMDPQPQLTCDMAVDAARDRLAGVVGVTEIDVRYGGFCPVGGRCQPFADDLTNARVIVRRENDADLVLVVSLRPDGTVEATEAAPMPGPTQLPGG